MDSSLRKIGPADLPALQLVTGDAERVEVEPVCPRCDGLGFFKKKVAYTHPDFCRLFPCECRQAEEERKRRAELLRLSNLDAFQDKTFKSFDPFVPGVSAACQKARAFALDPDGFLPLFGGYGCGKTHMLAAIGNELVGKRGVYFATCPDMLDQLRGTFDKTSSTSYSDLFEMIQRVDVLLLDDFTTENATAFAQEKLFQLFNHRYNYRLPTAITCNTRVDDPLFAQGGAYGRLMSRLRDRAVSKHGIVLIEAADYRTREGT
ncbi:MAG TPA: ATP-binding protein [Roseiflexaceae bacterium]|nr:ATP-binding protein [Roseiflexaceae bacterium]